MTDPRTVAAFLTRLGERVPLAKAADWDPVGLQLGDRMAPIARIAVCHEVTDAVVAAITTDPVDLLISYHPLLFRPTVRFVAGPGPEGRAYRLTAAGTALAVVHTAFDVAAGGTGDALAAILGLHEITGFGPAWPQDAVKIVTFVPESAVEAVAAAMAGAGAGQIGTYSGCSFRVAGTGSFFAGAGSDPAVGSPGIWNEAAEVRLEMSAPRHESDSVVAALLAAHPYEEPAFDVYDRRGDAGMVGRVGDLGTPVGLNELAAMVTERLGGVIRVAGDGAMPVQRVAVIPGSGGSFVTAASVTGAQVIVTGDVKHHAAQAALERGIAVIDPGHVATERPGVAALYAAVREMADDVVDLTGLDPDPWKAAG